jgi:hypothetical protein
MIDRHECMNGSWIFDFDLVRAADHPSDMVMAALSGSEPIQHGQHRQSE